MTAWRQDDASQKIWFIGDSKYYSDKNDIMGESVYKQFTYARNIIQYNINDLLDFSEGGNSGNYDVLRYRDPLTEGYSVTPNFFVRGEVDKGNPCEIPATGDAIKKDGADMWDVRNRHFENRLFDRDTLLLQVYDVNFLYVLKAFTAKGSGIRDEFKRTAREMFRKNFIELLNMHFYFWILWVKGPQSCAPYANKIEWFANKHYRALQGKMFRQKPDADYLILALEQDFVESSTTEKEFFEIRDAIKNDCEVFLTDAKDIFDEGEIQDKSKREKELARPEGFT